MRDLGIVMFQERGELDVQRRLRKEISDFDERLETGNSRHDSGIYMLLYLPATLLTIISNGCCLGAIIHPIHEMVDCPLYTLHILFEASVPLRISEHVTCIFQYGWPDGSSHHPTLLYHYQIKSACDILFDTKLWEAVCN